MNPYDLAGPAIVTGAGQGIGRAIATGLLQAGCPVIAIGRTAEKLHSLTEEAGVPAALAECHGLDIQDTAAVEAVLDRSAFGVPRYLVNGAGVLTASPIRLTTPEDIAATMAVNFTATLVLTQMVARRMVAAGQGAIVTIGSNSATAPRSGLGAYPASKAAITQAMKCLALDLAPFNVRCNVVAPGSTDTPMQHSYQTSPEALRKVVQGDLENWRLGIPLGRLADPQDVAELTLFLLSDKARHITMENIVLDGGATLGMR